MKKRSVIPMLTAKTGYIVMSVVYCIVGVLLVTHTQPSIAVLSRILGISLVVFGAVKLVGYFSRDLFRLAFQYDLEFGILLIALGVVVLMRPERVLEFLSVALGIATLADGLFKIQIALDARRFGIRSWWLILILALAATVVGLALAVQSWGGAQLLTVLLGISLLAEGILNLCVVLSAVKIVRHQQPDVIEGFYREVPSNKP